MRFLFVAPLLLFVLAACVPRQAPPGPGALAAAIAPAPSETAEEQDFEIETEEVFITADGYALSLRAWLPEEPPTAVILALHGFNDHSTFIAPAAEVWAAEDAIATYAYDQRGFGTAPNRGLWAGAATYAGDASEAARLLRNRYPEAELFLLGESMGGAIALAAATGEEPAPVDGVILAAPAVFARETMPFGQRVSLYVISHTLPWLALKPTGVRIQASDNIEALIALGQDPLTIKRTRMDAVYGLVEAMDLALASAGDLQVPALLLYGEKDELVPPGATLTFWERLPEDQKDSQRRVLYPEGWHLLFKDLQGVTVYRDVAAWIEDPIAPLPSAADSEAQERLSVIVEGD
ncbi:MAG: lysophospholipase [Pseudomonadota bacterium]